MFRIIYILNSKTSVLGFLFVLAAYSFPIKAKTKHFFKHKNNFIFLISQYILIGCICIVKYVNFTKHKIKIINKKWNETDVHTKMFQHVHLKNTDNLFIHYIFQIIDVHKHDTKLIYEYLHERVSKHLGNSNIKHEFISNESFGKIMVVYSEIELQEETNIHHDADDTRNKCEQLLTLLRENYDNEPYDSDNIEDDLDSDGKINLKYKIGMNTVFLEIDGAITEQHKRIVRHMKKPDFINNLKKFYKILIKSNPEFSIFFRIKNDDDDDATIILWFSNGEKEIWGAELPITNSAIDM